MERRRSEWARTLFLDAKGFAAYTDTRKARVRTRPRSIHLGVLPTVQAVPPRGDANGKTALSRRCDDPLRVSVHAHLVHGSRARGERENSYLRANDDLAARLVLSYERFYEHIRRRDYHRR